ncbi:UNVERIFIED_CONTAM: hypothetical protein K2H54_048649 [Gekko kuhli]
MSALQTVEHSGRLVIAHASNGSDQKTSAWYKRGLIYFDDDHNLVRVVAPEEAEAEDPKFQPLPKVEIGWPRDDTLQVPTPPAEKLPALTPRSSIGETLRKPSRSDKTVTKITLQFETPRAKAEGRGQREQTLPQLGVRPTEGTAALPRLVKKTPPRRWVRWDMPQQTPARKERKSCGLDTGGLRKREKKAKKTDRASQEEDTQPKRLPPINGIQQVSNREGMGSSVPLAKCAVFWGGLESEQDPTLPGSSWARSSAFFPTLKPRLPVRPQAQPTPALPPGPRPPPSSPLSLVGRRCLLHPK